LTIILPTIIYILKAEEEMRVLTFRVCSSCVLLAVLVIASGCGGGGEDGAVRPGRTEEPGAGLSGVWVIDNLGTLELIQEPGEDFDSLSGHLMMDADELSVRYSAAGSFTPPEKVRLSLSVRGVRIMTLNGVLKGGNISGEILAADGEDAGEWFAVRQ
jgi:hypothetical protein